MSSRGKKKTTMAKMNREMRQRERRREKAVRKEARRNAPPAEELDQPAEAGVEAPESLRELPPQ